MAADIFDFWSQIGPTEHIHPADRDVFRRLGLDGHGFNLKALPGCFMGPLKTAPVVLLYLSPGEGEEEKTEPSDALIEWHVKTRSGTAPLVLAEDHPGAYKWWVSRTKCFGCSPVMLSTKVALLNIGAYHSKDFTDHGLLAALPSSRASLGWAQSVLFPEAEAGKRVVICLRSAEFWGLGRGQKYGQSLFTPNVNRGGHMLNDDMRNEVIAAARRAIGAN